MKKKTRIPRPSSLPRDVERLCWLAKGLAQSGSRIEDRYWERLLGDTVRALLEAEDEAALERALDHLYQGDPQAYEELSDVLDSEAETLTGVDKNHDLVLVAAPVLAWSRFQIPARPIPQAVRENLRVHLGAHIFAAGVKFALFDYLFSPDQLPQGFVATRRWLQAAGKDALAERDHAVDRDALPESAVFLSDIRYVLVAAAVPKEGPIFTWQEAEGDRDFAFAQWRKQAGPVLTQIMPGCGTEPELPDAYFTASRKANRDARPFAIHAAIAFLAAEADIAASHLRAVIAPCESQGEFEYRIGLALKHGGQVVHGIPWPLLGADETEAEAERQIQETLKAVGIHDIVTLRRTLPLEFCEDCGAPLFPNAEGELVHAELPAQEEDEGDNPNHTPSGPRYLH
ncbi:DUF2863 family protein [Tepidiphilus margaritifer]|uniref:DUF2863 family protein n=1 Tax=Tepidiphilus margaritifer TaxID=203471 RepID=UPI0003FFF549|nr:DUF2863 family protein [Tepidiphilus margaritifer]